MHIVSHKGHNYFIKKPHSHKRSSQNKTSLTSTIDGVVGDHNIAKMWGSHFQKLLNTSVITSAKSFVTSKCANVGYSHEMQVTVGEVCKAIRFSKTGKAPDHHGVTSEHCKYASNYLTVMLSILFSCMFIHSYIPQKFMLSTVVPLIKNKSGDLTSKDNYRPIAINSILSKMFEFIILNRYSTLLETSHNQFGFKSKSSTDLCIYTMKQVIEYYRNQSSCVYVCFLDASKAFDRVNHWLLLKKLIERDIPPFVIRLLMFWYTEQLFCVRWGNKKSSNFHVKNGLRQGGILSPIFFNVFIDELSIQLTSSNTGCKLLGMTMNHLMYADDMTLIAPSAKGLQSLLHTCENYAIKHEIIFNSIKSMCMCVTPKCHRPSHIPSVRLNNQQLEFTDTFKYLGCIITNTMDDTLDISKQMRSIYARSNMLNVKFGCCTKIVKSLLFQSYCTNLYCSHLWWNYRRDMYKKIMVAYNNCFRRFIGYMYDSSASQMFLENNVLHFKVLRRKCLQNFMNRLNSSENNLIKHILATNLLYHSTFYKEWCTIMF